MIDITLLGTSSLMPLPERALTAAVLSCGGRSILFDCGEGTQSAARKAGVSLMRTDVVALTHYHGDHIFGLPGLLQTLFSLGRTEPLFITAPHDIVRELAPILTLAGALSYKVYLIELPEEGIALHSLVPAFPEGARLSAFVTKHRSVSQGYCFTLARAGKFLPERARELGIPVTLWSRLQKGETVEADGQSFFPEQVLGEARKGLKFVFTGDTSPCESLTDAARDADLLLCEATYGETEEAALALERGHMTYAMAAQTARDAKAKRLWLAHYSQKISEPEEYLPNAAAIFPNTECGTDGMHIQLRFEE